jgi:myotubularin-related protein 6/7/8
MVGVTNNRSAQDEKLVSSIFQSQYADTPYSIAAESRARASKADPPVYGSTSTNLIIDARPTVNAMVMTAKGAGTENMDHYKDARKAYLGVENIHVMRDSLAKVVEALREADAVLAMPGLEVSPDGRIGAGAGVLDRQALRRSGWLRHITCLLEGTVLIVRNIHINSSHVLIHCSDGWDRTSQLSALAQLCLDPFYRTYRGFQVLIEKDWLSFGYKFADRCGHLSSDKFFVSPPNTDGADAAQAFLASVQNKFASQSHLKETSPVFHQFLECVRQMQRQFPTRFEFNERFLERLHYHLYSCQFGTFLYNSERERRTSEQGTLPPYALTKSIWDYFNSTKERPKFLNPDYEPSLDDRNSRAPGADMGVLLPNPKDVRFWHELYGRSDEDMNGRIATSQLVGVEVVGPIEGAEDDPIIKALPISRSPSPAPSSSDTLSIPYKPRTLVRRNSAVSVPDSLLPPSSPSLPDLSNRPTTPQPQGLLRPSVSSSNVPNRSWTLGSPGTSTPPSASTQPPERRPGPSAAVNTAGGMKSVWGKLSQNASAAFSAVQGAYGEATKDFKGLSLMSGVDSDGRSDELKPWDNAGNREASEASNGWGQSDYQPVARLPSADLRNPWSDSNVIPGTAGLSNVPRPIPVPAFPRESITPPAALFHPPSRPRSQPEVLASVSPEANQGFPLSSSPRPDPLRTASSVLPSPPAQDADLPVNPRPTRSNPLPASPRPQSPIAQNPSANQDPLGVGFL